MARLQVEPVRQAGQDPQPGAPTAYSDRTALLAAVATAGASRLILLVAGVAAGGYLPLIGVDRLHVRLHWTWRAALAHPLHGWAHWDGRWFLLVAKSGYSAAGAPAFYPLYPSTVKLSAAALRDSAAAAEVVSALCFVAAAYVLYRLVAHEFGPRVAVFTVAFLAVAPTSFFFQAAYSESLFRLLSVGSLRLAQRRRWLLAGVVGLLACLTRASGVVLDDP